MAKKEKEKEPTTEENQTQEESQATNTTENSAIVDGLLLEEEALKKIPVDIYKKLKEEYTDKSTGKCRIRGLIVPDEENLVLFTWLSYMQLKKIQQTIASLPAEEKAREESGGGDIFTTEVLKHCVLYPSFDEILKMKYLFIETLSNEIVLYSGFTNIRPTVYRI